METASFGFFLFIGFVVGVVAANRDRADQNRLIDRQRQRIDELLRANSEGLLRARAERQRADALRRGVIEAFPDGFEVSKPHRPFYIYAALLNDYREDARIAAEHRAGQGRREDAKTAGASA